jgi:hypothetical protein
MWAECAPDANAAAPLWQEEQLPASPAALLDDHDADPQAGVVASKWQLTVEHFAFVNAGSDVWLKKTPFAYEPPFIKPLAAMLI